MARFQHDRYSAALERLVQCCCHLGPQALLQLQALGKEPDQAGQLAEAQHHALGGHIRDVAAAMEWQQHLLRGGGKVNVPHKDHA